MSRPPLRNSTALESLSESVKDGEYQSRSSMKSVDVKLCMKGGHAKATTLPEPKHVNQSGMLSLLPL